MINPIALARTLNALKGLTTMNKADIAKLLRTHGETATKLIGALATAATDDKDLIPDAANLIDGTGNLPGFGLKHFGALLTVAAIVKADPVLLAELRTLVPHK